MRLLEREEGKNAAESLVQRLIRGEFPEKCLANHSIDFTGGPEQLARVAFNHYLGSCGYALMQRRLEEKGSSYHG